MPPAISIGVEVHPATRFVMDRLGHEGGGETIPQRAFVDDALDVHHPIVDELEGQQLRFDLLLTREVDCVVKVADGAAHAPDQANPLLTYLGVLVEGGAIAALGASPGLL